MHIAHPPAPAIATPRGRYLYAIVDRGVDQVPLGFAGVDGSEVYALGDDRIAAIVSDLPDKKVRPERRRLAAPDFRLLMPNRNLPS